MVVLAFVLPLAGLVKALARDRVLVTAERDAEAIARLLGAMPTETRAAGARAVVGGGTLPGGASVTVALPDGTMVGHIVPLDEYFARAAAGSSFRQPVEGGEAVFVSAYQASEPSAAVVRVFVADEALTRNVAASWAVLGGLGLALVALAALVADRLARSIVKPVQELSEAAHRLGEGELDVLVEPAGPPEVVDVAHAFNRLGSRIRVLLSEERESAADISHRLRTPLTVLRLDVEAIGDGDLASRLSGDLDELERTVDHVINQARRPMREGTGAVCDLAAIVADRVAFWGALADDQQRRWTLTKAPEGHPIAAPAEDVAAAVDALLGNVLAHTAEGVPFHVDVHGEGRWEVLTVEDGGPGFPHRAVVERGTSASGSTGLGLDIVRRTALASGGDIEVGTGPLGGARVVVRFGAPGSWG